eukprot:5301299-Pyramimonas_sp.AAC.1
MLIFKAGRSARKVKAGSVQLRTSDVPDHARARPIGRGFYPRSREGTRPIPPMTVSYTHLTLPTILLV